MTMGVAASDRSPWGRAPAAVGAPADADAATATAASTPAVSTAATTVRTAVSRVCIRGL